MSEYECEECDYTTKYKNGLNVHYGKKHKGRTPPTYETFICEQCGKKEELEPFIKENKRFCSSECFYKWRKEKEIEISDETRRKLSDSKIGPKNPMYGKSLSQSHKRKISKSLKGTTHSEETRKRMSEAKQGRNNPRRKEKIIIECEYCGTKNKRQPCSLRKTKHDRYFCNKECYDKWKKGENNPMYGEELSEEAKQKISEAHKGKEISEETKKKISETLTGKYTGEESSNWKGGQRRGELEHMYGDYSFWIKQHKKAKKRDNYQCQYEEDNEHSERLLVHHILPRRNFDKSKVDWYKEAHKLFNLITLCSKHHGKIECNWYG